MGINYRTDIDGLRAVAVLSVLCFHAGIPGFTGGYVGVDVFFVISGFLITSNVTNEIHEERFSIFKFYEHRIRRIFPALFLVIIFTLIAGFIFFNYIAFKSLGKSVMGTTFFASNIIFWRELGYFDAASITKPLLHTWSLAVEEQFYLFYPIFLLVINKISKNNYFAWIFGIGTVSLLLCIVWTYTHHGAAFYLMPTRAWEMFFGSILALGVMPRLQTGKQRSLFSSLGLGLIFYSVVFYTEMTLFPGIAALVPVLGASLIIYSGMDGASAIGKFLSCRPMVYLGLISYSLYLWHWPLLVFANNLIARDLTPREGVGIMLLTYGISVISLKYIELPFRRAKVILPQRTRFFFLSAAIMLLVSMLGGVVYLQNGMPYRSSNNNSLIMQSIDSNELEAEPEYDLQSSKLTSGSLPARVGTATTTPCFLLWGDSHARALIPAISAQATWNGYSGFITTQSAHPPVLGLDGIDSNMNVFCRHAFNDSVLSFVAHHPEIKTVFLAAAWEAYSSGTGFMEKGGVRWHLKDVVGEAPDSFSPRLLKLGLTRTVAALLQMGRNIVIISDIPNLGHDPITVYWSSTRFGEQAMNVLPTRTEHRERNKYIYAMLQELALLPKVTVIYPENWLMNQGKPTRIIANDRLLYRDSHHLTKFGAEYVAPAFDEVFKKMAIEKQ